MTRMLHDKVWSMHIFCYLMYPQLNFRLIFLCIKMGAHYFSHFWVHVIFVCMWSLTTGDNVDIYITVPPCGVWQLWCWLWWWQCGCLWWHWSDQTSHRCLLWLWSPTYRPVFKQQSPCQIPHWSTKRVEGVSAYMATKRWVHLHL